MNFINDWNREEIEKKIGYSFKTADLLKEAFTHKSYFNENKESVSFYNERLEFLGDAVLQLVSSAYLFGAFPDEPEGTLTKYRSNIVDTKALASFTGELELGPHLLLGRGEAMQSDRAKDSLFANLFEAVLGAIYLDGGFESAQKFFNEKIAPHLGVDFFEQRNNFKALFQEEAQRVDKITPTYEVLVEEGPSHARFFKVAAKLDERVVGEGEGRTKKEAEQNAAEDALNKRKGNG